MLWLLHEISERDLAFDVPEIRQRVTRTDRFIFTLKMSATLLSSERLPGPRT